MVNVVIIKKQSAGRGALTGALSGFLVGGITGVSLGNDPSSSFIHMTAVQKGLLIGVAGTAIGAAIGVTIVALSKHKYYIGGKKEKFDAFHKSVLEMAYSNIQQ